MKAMKGRKLKMLYVAAFALLLPACQDDDGKNATGQAVTFTSTIRALEASAENEDWSGTLDPRVAVQADGTVKMYKVDSEGNLVSDDPFHWNGGASLTVAAWYPYNNGIRQEEVVVKANQATPSLFQQSNLMEVGSTEVTPDNPALTFVHRTVKVVCNLSAPDETASRADYDPFAGAQVTLLNIQGTDEGNGRVITTANHAAYIPPQTIAAGTEFAELKLADGREMIIKLEEDYNAEQGHKTTFDIVADPEAGRLDITVSDKPSWDSSEDFTDIPSTPGDEEEEDPDWEEEGSEDLDIDSPEIQPGDGQASWEGGNAGNLDGNSPEAQPGGDAEWNEGGDDKLEAGSSTAQPDADASWDGDENGENINAGNSELNPGGSASWEGKDEAEDLTGQVTPPQLGGSAEWSGTEESLTGTLGPESTTEETTTEETTEQSNKQ